MRFKLLILLCVAMVFVSSACAGQQDSAKTPGNTTGRDTIPGTTEKRQEIPPIVSPEIGISDSREHQNGGWLVTIPEEAGHVYRVSSDNDVWVKFSFAERMEEADVLAHLIVEPAAKVTTDWSNTSIQYSFRVHVFPSTESPLRIGLTAGARNLHGTRALAEDITVTLERFPAPWVTMYLKKHPSLKMREYGFYFASPEDAEVVMEFTKPMDRGSLAKALAGIAQPEEFKLNWLNDQKAIVKLTPRGLQLPASTERSGFTKPLTLNEIADTFRNKGLDLVVDDFKAEEDLTVLGVRPVVFRIGETENRLFVYLYQSLEERKEASEKIRASKTPKTFFEQRITTRYFPAKNALIMYHIVYYPEETPWERFGDEFSKVRDVVFWDLNEGKEIVFKGESPHWGAQVTLQYYEHFWKDDRGVVRHENDYIQKSILRYKGSKPEEIKEIYYRFETAGPSCSGKLEQPHFSKDGTISVGSGGGSGGHIPRENDIYNVKIEWNGQEETFELRALIQ